MSVFLRHLPRVTAQQFSALHTCSPLRLEYRSDGWWISQHKPHRVPRTAEDRRSAAIRYGMREEDYEPYDETIEPTGDYPDYGVITSQQRDPYENWSYKQYRRNWGEGVPFHWQNFHPMRASHSGIEAPSVSGYLQFIYLFGFWGGAIGLFIWSLKYSNMRITSCKMPKQFPYDFKRAFPYDSPQKYPIVNFTFEHADGSEEPEDHH